MKNIEKLFNRAMKVVSKYIGKENIGKITEFYINDRLTDSWGKCAYYDDTDTYAIEINAKILDDNIPDKPVMEVFIHEILHACKGGLTHRGKWKEYAEIINHNTKYHIQAEKELDEFGLEKNAKYLVVCDKCGEKVYKNRMCKFVQHPELYEHIGCGGTFKRVF